MKSCPEAWPLKFVPMDLLGSLKKNGPRKHLHSDQDRPVYQNDKLHPASQCHSRYGDRCISEVLGLPVRRLPAYCSRQRKTVCCQALRLSLQRIRLQPLFLPSQIIRRQTSQQSGPTKRMCSDSDIALRTTKQTGTSVCSRLHFRTVSKLTEEQSRHLLA